MNSISNSPIRNEPDLLKRVFEAVPNFVHKFGQDYCRDLLRHWFEENRPRLRRQKPGEFGPIYPYLASPHPDTLLTPRPESESACFAIGLAVYAAYKSNSDQYTGLGPSQINEFFEFADQNVAAIATWQVLIHELQHIGDYPTPVPETMAVVRTAIQIIESALVDNSSTRNNRRRGRKKANYETCQSELQIKTLWVSARDNRIPKSEFAKDQGMTKNELDRLLDRVYRRQRVKTRDELSE